MEKKSSIISRLTWNGGNGKSEILDKVRQMSIEFHLPNRKADIEKSYLTIQDFRSLVNFVKSIDSKMTRFETRINIWSGRMMKNVNIYFGPICFEISLHQVLPY